MLLLQNMGNDELRDSRRVCELARQTKYSVPDESAGRVARRICACNPRAKREGANHNTTQLPDERHVTTCEGDRRRVYGNVRNAYSACQK